MVQTLKCFLRVPPVLGSGLSNTKLAESSHLEVEHMREDKAACLATKVEYFILQLKEIMDWNGGTKGIFVLSGKSFDLDPYTIWIILPDNFCPF